MASNPFKARNLSKRLLTFSSKRNLTFDGDADIFFSFGDAGSIVQGSFYMLFGQGRKFFKNFFDTHPTFQHFQYLPHHDSSALERRLAVAYFTVGYNMLANFESHETTNKLLSFDIFNFSHNSGIKTFRKVNEK